MEFKRAPIWAYAIAVGMLTGSSGWAQTPPVVEGPQMEAFFTEAVLRSTPVMPMLFEARTACGL